MRITLTRRDELDTLIKAVKQMADTGEVSFDFGSDGIVLACSDACSRNADMQDAESLRQSDLKQLEKRKEWNEAYTAGRIDSLMTALDIGLITITDAAVLLDMDDQAIQRIYEIWHDDDINA